TGPSALKCKHFPALRAGKKLRGRRRQYGAVGGRRAGGGSMANRSDTDRGGRGQPQALVEIRGRDDSDDAAGGSTEVGSRVSTWERMLEALSGEDEAGPQDFGPGSLRASIAERLHTRGGSPMDDGLREAQVRPVRRRRRSP